MQEPWIDWLFSLEGPSIKWDLETMSAFAAALGHPERGVRILHVAGTNAKGSVAAMVQATACAAGLRAGLYTSPHLVRPEERIRIGTEEISSDALRDTILRLRDVAAAELAAGRLPRHPSFFEMMTAAAFVEFAAAKVDLAVVETGLGGRLDATNIVDPEVCVITTIGLDHVQALGGTRALIAREKAGIVKPGRPVLCGWLPAAARHEIAERAANVHAPVHWAARELSLRPGDKGTLRVRTPRREYTDLRLALGGPYQRRNAALAVRAAELLAERGVPIDDAAIARGLASVRWPGRMEQLAIGRVPALLDGAHNPDGARELGRALRDRDGARHRRRVLVFGMTRGRQADELLFPLAGLVDHVVVVSPPTSKAVEPTTVRAQIAAALPALPVETADRVADALPRAAQLAGEDGEVVVAGSLYLVGDARRELLGLQVVRHPTRETDVAPAKGTP